jgi:hypothetical protein
MPNASTKRTASIIACVAVAVWPFGRTAQDGELNPDGQRLADVCECVTVGYVGPMKDQYVDDGVHRLEEA